MVDEQNKLLGIITHDDILDVMEDEAEEDMYRPSSASATTSPWNTGRLNAHANACPGSRPPSSAWV